MHLRLLVGVVTMFVIAASAAAESQSCKPGILSRKALAETEKVQQDIYRRAREPSVSREKLVRLREAEKSCTGQFTLDYFIAAHDVQFADLQSAIDASGTILAMGTDQYRHTTALETLARRFTDAGEYEVALSIVLRAREMFPTQANFLQPEIMLLAKTGNFEGARVAADKLLSESWDNPRPERIPRSGWIRLAVSELSGDELDEAHVIEVLKEHVGDSAVAQIAQNRRFATAELLLTRSYFGFGAPPHTEFPRPNYPLSMQHKRISGTCESYFDIDEAGRPQDIISVCSDEAFAPAATKGLRESTFEISVHNGQPFRVLDVQYPMEFNIY